MTTEQLIAWLVEADNPTTRLCAAEMARLHEENQWLKDRINSIAKILGENHDKSN